MSARTRAAIDEAAQSNWRIDDLQAWAGGLIAEATGAEAGWVTSGAAAGLTLAAAACIAGTRLDAIDRLPEPGAVPAEIIVQRGHRNAYDRQLRNVGARLVEVGYPANEGIGQTLEWQLEAAFGERTVAVAHLACADHLGLPLERVCEHRPRPRRARCWSTPRPSCRRARTCAGSRRPAPTPSASPAARRCAARRAPASWRRRAAIAASVRLQVLDMDVDARAWRAREGAGAAAPRSRPRVQGRAGGDRRPRHGAAGVRRARPRRRGRRRRPPGSRRCRARSSPTAVSGRSSWSRPATARRTIAAALAAADPGDHRAARAHARRRDRDLPRGDPARRPRPRRGGTARCDRLGPRTAACGSNSNL